MKHIFISRFLSPESPFFSRLSGGDYHIYHQSLITFSAVPIDSIPPSVILFFYSKNAVRYAVQHPLLHQAMQQRLLAVMGAGTAKMLQSFGFEPDFIGSPKRQDTAKRLSQKFAPEQKILFLRASHSQQSIQGFLPKDHQAESLIVYKNEPKTDFEIPTSDFLIFTSPMNAQAYFSKYTLQKGQYVLAIGHTTAQALHDLGIGDVHIAAQPSEENLVDLVLGMNPF